MKLFLYKKLFININKITVTTKPVINPIKTKAMIAALLGLMAVSVVIVVLNASHWRGEEIKPVYDKTGKITGCRVEDRHMLKWLSDELFKKEATLR